MVLLIAGSVNFEDELAVTYPKVIAFGEGGTSDNSLAVEFDAVGRAGVVNNEA